MDLNTVLAANNEFASVTSDVVNFGDDSLDSQAESYEWAYWRKPDGYIVQAPFWSTEAMNKMLMKWEPLQAYGTFNIMMNPQEPGGVWRPTTEPWRRILARGGAREFLAEQVLELWWHVKPPYKNMKFPQIQFNPDGTYTYTDKNGNVVIGKDYYCDMGPCASARIPYSSQSALSKHQSIAHKDTSQDNRTARAFSQANAPIETLVKVLSENQEKANKRAEEQEFKMAQLQTQMATAMTAMAEAIAQLRPKGKSTPSD